MKNLKKIWKNKDKIVEGVMNSIFTSKTIEDTAQFRLSICKSCESYDVQGVGCVIPGTSPCCNQLNGGCGCSLHYKVRSLSSDCPKLKWIAVMTQEQEDNLKR